MKRANTVILAAKEINRMFGVRRSSATSQISSHGKPVCGSVDSVAS